MTTRPAPAEYDCLRCGYHWKTRLPYGRSPKVCPYCRSYRWQVAWSKFVKKQDKNEE